MSIMSRNRVHAFALSLAVLLLTPRALAQQSATPANKDCGQDTCVSKVLSLPNFSTGMELQEVVNTLRTIVGFRYILPNQPDHTISLKGTPEQLAMAGKLVSVLESFRASGSQDRSSVLVYQFKGPQSGTPEAARILAQSPQRASTTCELNTCFAEALYIPGLSMSQLQDVLNRIRSNTDMTRICPSPSSQVIMILGTAEQVAYAEKLANQ